jgi:hypothetical protein
VRKREDEGRMKGNIMKKVRAHDAMRKKIAEKSPMGVCDESK